MVLSKYINIPELNFIILFLKKKFKQNISLTDTSRKKRNCATYRISYRSKIMAVALVYERNQWCTENLSLLLLYNSENYRDIQNHHFGLIQIWIKIDSNF